MASWHALDAGCDVILFEKQKKAARKLLISGNGRCNISNRNIHPSRYHGRDVSFVKKVFSHFSPEETEHFFLSLGIPFVEGKEGKLYPASLQSSSVQKILQFHLNRKGLEMRLHRQVVSIERNPDSLAVVTAGKERIECDAVIISSGSPTYGQLGGSRDGYQLAREMGHTVYDPFPALLPLNILEEEITALQGQRWDVTLAVYDGDAILDRRSGELLFTAYGISGPVALDVSRAVNEKIISNENGNLKVGIDFFPHMERDTLAALLSKIWDGMNKSKKAAFSLYGIMKENMPETIMKMAGLDISKNVEDLTVDEKEKLIAALKDTRITPGRIRGFNEAVIAAGGVSTDEVDPETMASYIDERIYFSGEVLDIDGDSGGFNLQFAWSSGAVAGMAQGA